MGSETYQGCTDHGCIYLEGKPRRGMGTNGGCRCDPRRLLESYRAQLTQATAWRRWTSEKPTVKGLYRVRYEVDTVRIERIIEVNACPFVSSRPDDLWCPLGWVKELSMEWAGPIPEGVEP